MKNIKKIITSVLLVSSLANAVSFAAVEEPKTDNTGFSPIEAYEKQQEGKDGEVTPRLSTSKELKIGGENNGKLIVNSSIDNWGEVTGNTRSWDYIVSSVYEGTRSVKSIRTTWQLQASLRNSASLSMGFGTDSVSAGSGESWTTVKSAAKYYENTNGSKGAYMPSKSNFIVSPDSDYKPRTATVTNTGKVVLQGVPGSHEYSAAATPLYK